MNLAFGKLIKLIKEIWYRNIDQTTKYKDQMIFYPLLIISFLQC